MRINILGTSRSGHHFIGEVVESWFKDVDCAMIQYLTNVEPKDLGQYNINGMKIIVIRDYKNFLASSVMSFLGEHGEDSPWRESIAHKIKCYNAILKESFYPKQFNADVVIYYDQFFEDAEYRKDVCGKLGGVYTEERLNFISAEGNGSSFDKLTLQDKGQEMKVTDRHIQILETEWKDIYEDLLN